MAERRQLPPQIRRVELGTALGWQNRRPLPPNRGYGNRRRKAKTVAPAIRNGTRGTRRLRRGTRSTHAGVVCTAQPTDCAPSVRRLARRETWLETINRPWSQHVAYAGESPPWR